MQKTLDDFEIGRVYRSKRTDRAFICIRKSPKGFVSFRCLFATPQSKDGSAMGLYLAQLTNFEKVIDNRDLPFIPDILLKE